MFTQIEDPYWYFPEGIYLEQYDSVFNVEFSIEADTAYYFEERELWRLIGEVFIQNNEGETFETEELFWDSKKPKTSIEAIYTDKQVRITQTDRIIISQGLRANSAMTNYRLFEMYTEMYIDDDEMAVNKEEPEQPSDSIHQ